MDTITDILARPGEAARQLSEMRAALEAVTAQLAAVTGERNALTAQLAAKDAELSEFRLAVQRDILSRLDVTLPQLAAVTAERDAARAEVARLTALITEHNAAAEKTCAKWQAEGYCMTAGYKIRCSDCPCEWEIDPALCGDTAPAQPAGTNVVSLNSLHECDTCGHLMVDHDRTDDGRRVCMRLGCNCLEPAPAGRE